VSITITPAPKLPSSAAGHGESASLSPSLSLSLSPSLPPSLPPTPHLNSCSVSPQLILL
jgi:hypothetical protein